MLFARLTIIASDPEMADAMPAPQQRPLHAGEIPGLRAVYCLIDRDSGRSASLSIWESREAMEATEARGAERRVRAASTIDGTVLSVDRMEVVNWLWTE